MKFPRNPSKYLKHLVDIQKSVVSLKEGIEHGVQNSYRGKHGFQKMWGMDQEQVISPKKVGLLNLVILVINVNK